MRPLQGVIHPVFWPLQLAGAVVTFGAFLGVIAATYTVLAVYETLQLDLGPIGRQ